MQCTVEPRYFSAKFLGTMKITLLYQVSHYIRVKRKKKYKELGPAKLPCYNRVCYIRPLYNEVPLYIIIRHLINSFWYFECLMLLPPSPTEKKASYTHDADNIPFGFYVALWTCLAWVSPKRIMFRKVESVFLS